MLMSARRVGAEEALAKGLVSRLLPRDGFAAAARAYASDLAQGAPASFAMMKHQLRHADGGDFEAARASAADWTRKTLDAPDFKEALAAKREGRARSEEHTSGLQSLMRSSYAVFCLKNKNTTK